MASIGRAGGFVLACGVMRKIAGFWWIWGLLAGPVAGQEGLLDRGEALSVAHCSRCHVVDAARPFAGISSTPSFALMVNNLEDWEDRFRSFFARLPHPSVIRIEGDAVDAEAPPAAMRIELGVEDVDAILAYAESLAEE